MKATTVKTIPNTVHRHYSPPKKKTLKIKLPILKPKLIHIRKALIQKIIQLPPPLNLQSTERNHRSPKPNLTTKLTPDLESKVIGPPDFRTKSGGHPSTSIHQRNTKSRQTRLQLDSDSRSRSKSNRPTGNQHTKSKTNDKTSGGANNKHIKKKMLSSTGSASFKHPKHLNDPNNPNKS